MNKTKICGIIPPIVTPFSTELELDSPALEKLLNFVINGDVNGIFILGTNGECASLTNQIKEDIISKAVEVTTGRLPVFVNITTASFLETMHLSRVAGNKGADYIVMAPPYYFDMNQVELYNYYKMIADQSSLPLVLYNAPQYTKTAIELDTVVKLAAHQNIVGLKDSSGSMFYLHQLLTKLADEDFSILVGTEVFLGESLLLGMDGGVNGGANIFPKLYVEMYKAGRIGNLNEMKKWQALIQKVQNVVYDALESPMSIVIGLKYILSLRGICNPQMAMPVYKPLDDKYKKRMANLLEEFNAIGL